MAQVPDLTQIAQTAQDVANDTAAAAFTTLNTTEGWTIGPDGEFDGDPEEPRFAVLVFYCILVSPSILAVYDKKTCEAHCEKVLFVQAVMICAQSGLFYWKKQQKRSYELVGCCPGGLDRHSHNAAYCT